MLQDNLLKIELYICELNIHRKEKKLYKTTFKCSDYTNVKSLDNKCNFQYRQPLLKNMYVFDFSSIMLFKMQDYSETVCDKFKPNNLTMCKIN